MSQHTYTTTLELAINGHSCEREVTVRYDHEPSGGDGWNEPRYGERAFVYSVETTVHMRGHSQEVDLMPLLTKEVIEGLEADCCKHEAEERECRASEYAEWKRETTWEAL